MRWLLEDGPETQTVQAATAALHPVSCSRQIHHADPWPQLLWKTRMNQINIEEALGSGSRSAEPMDSAGGEERVINKVPLHMLYILQSLMISSVFP